MTIYSLILATAAGFLLGLFFFGGLWLTVQHLARSRHAALLMISSLLVRLTLTVSGFYFVMQETWHNLLACLFGFLIARTLVVRRLRPDVYNQQELTTPSPLEE